MRARKKKRIGGPYNEAYCILGSMLGSHRGLTKDMKIRESG